MKKVLALVLAVMMMSTVAFAASGALVGEPTYSDSGRHFVPGDKIYIYSSDFARKGTTGVAVDPQGSASFTSEYFSITKKKFEKGSSLVESVTFNDAEERIEIKLKENYSLETPDKAANLIIEALEIKCKKDTGVADNFEKNKTYELCDTAMLAGEGLYIGWNLQEEDIYDGEDAVYTNGLVKYVDDTSNESYGTMYLNFDDVAYGEVRVYDGDKVNLDWDEDVDTDIVKAYPDADLRFVNFNGDPTFSATMAFELYAEEGEYCYEVVNGKLVESKLTWDDDAYAFTGRTRTLGSYVISDIELDVSAIEDVEDGDNTTGGTNVGNPDTGANDVMGIAVALAVVATASAAAISLKK